MHSSTAEAEEGLDIPPPAFTAGSAHRSVRVTPPFVYLAACLLQAECLPIDNKWLQNRS